MKIYRKKYTLILLIAYLLCALSLYAGGEGEKDHETELSKRNFVVFSPEFLGAADEGMFPGEAEELSADFTDLLVQNLGGASKIGKPGVSGSSDIRQYALIEEADTAVYGFFLAEKSLDSGYFGRLVLRIVKLAANTKPFSLVYQGKFFMEEPDSMLSLVAERAAADIIERTGPLNDDEREVLSVMTLEAKGELRARRTVVLTLRSKPDPEARVILQDGTSPGTLADGELSFEIPAESRYRMTVVKSGHYTRIVEGRAKTEDISRSVPELYPEQSSDAGFVFSYLRPFGILLEARYRLFQESATLGVSAGLFPLPDYWDDYVFAPDFGDVLIESELGFHVGWYPFTRPDSLWRVQLELNMRINTYTNPYQDWRTLRALMLGPGLRFELNRPAWLVHLGIRGYYPNYTPAKMGDSGIVLINLGAAWKN